MLQHQAVVALDRRRHHPVVEVEGHRHLGGYRVPELRRPHDVGEDEGHHPDGGWRSTSTPRSLPSAVRRCLRAQYGDPGWVLAPGSGRAPRRSEADDGPGLGLPGAPEAPRLGTSVSSPRSPRQGHARSASAGPGPAAALELHPEGHRTRLADSPRRRAQSAPTGRGRGGKQQGRMPLEAGPALLTVPSTVRRGTGVHAMGWRSHDGARIPSVRARSGTCWQRAELLTIRLITPGSWTSGDPV